MLIALSMERETRAPLVVADELLDFFGDQYVALPPWTRRRISFERFLVYQVRNQALFEKLRHHRSHRNGRSALRMRGGES